MFSLLPPTSPETLDRCRDIFETSQLSTSILMPEAPETHQGLMVHFDEEVDLSNLYKDLEQKNQFWFTDPDLFNLVRDFQIVDYINAIVTPPNNWDITKIHRCDPPHSDVLEPGEENGVVTSLSKNANQTRILPTLYQFREDVARIVSQTDWSEIAPEIASQETIATLFKREFNYTEEDVKASDCSKINIDRALKYFGNPNSDFSFLCKDMKIFRENIYTLIPCFSQYIYDQIPAERKYAKKWRRKDTNIVMHWSDIFDSLLHSRARSEQWEDNILTGAFISK